MSHRNNIGIVADNGDGVETLSPLAAELGLPPKAQHIASKSSIAASKDSLVRVEAQEKRRVFVLALFSVFIGVFHDVKTFEISSSSSTERSKISIICLIFSATPRHLDFL